MTAVLPETRTPAGRHRAPEDAQTGSMGVVPADLRSRTAHGSHRTVTAPLGRAARTAGLSLAALGALATAGGVATHGFSGADEPAATGEMALPTNLASADMAVRPAAAPLSAPVSAPAVMPVSAPSAPSVAKPQIKTVSASSKAASTAKSEAAAKKASDKASAAKKKAEASSVASSKGAKAVAAAKGQMGVPYVWGGTDPDGFDCSGLMQWAYDKAGIDLPRTSAAQSKEGEKVSVDELQPGDLVFFYSPVSHVAMYAGNGMVVEAPTEGQDVKMTKLSKLEKNMVSARRL